MENENRTHQKDMFSRIGDDREELHQWLIMDTWPKEAAMFLIAGVIPTQIYEGFGFFKVTGGLLHNHDGEKDERIHQIEDLTRLWDSNPNHPDRAEPKYFFDWAEAKGIEVPWLEGAKKAGYFKDLPSPGRGDGVGPKVQNTLLCIIAALCKEAKLDYTKPAKTAALIQSAAAQMGVSLGETTIEGYLKKIPDALAARAK